MTLGRACRIVATAALTVLVCSGGAGAAATSWEPHPEGARTFTGGSAGWTASVTQTGGGLTCSGLLHVPGMTCPAVSNGWQAGGGDGSLRTSLSTAVGLLATTTVDWTSPSFTLAARPDVAAFGFELRGSGGSLIDLGGAGVAADLVDLGSGGGGGGGAGVALLAQTAVAPSAGFNAYGGPLAPAALTAGHTYAVRVRMRFATPLGVAVRGALELDDVALQLTDLDPPTGLSARVSADTVGVRVSGSVDPHGQPTTVTVDYGPTSAYGASTSVAVGGSGAQPFSLPLAGLRPATAYRYRVSAVSPDGMAATTDAGFVSPAESASDGAPMLVGSSSSRQRIAVFDLDAAVTQALVEVRDATGTTLLDSFPDADLDGSATIALPATGATYRVRVVRTRAGAGAGAGAQVASPFVDAVLAADAAAPDVSQTLVIVAPWSSVQRARTVTVLGAPSDVVSRQLQVLDAADAPLGAPVALGIDGSATVTLPDRAGSYRVRATFRDAGGNASVARSLPAVLMGAAVPPDEPTPSDPPDDPAPPAADPSPSPPSSRSSPNPIADPSTGALPIETRARTTYPLEVAVPCAIRPGSSIRPPRRNGVCPGRVVVGRIAAMKRTVGGVRVQLRAARSSVIGGSEPLRFTLSQRGRARLKGIEWKLGARPLRAPSLTAVQLRADGGQQTLSVRLVPRRGRAVTLRVVFRTRAV